LLALEAGGFASFCLDLDLEGAFFSKKQRKKKKKEKRKKRNNDDCGRSDLFCTQVASSLSSVIERVTTKDLSELQQVRGKEEEDFFFGFFCFVFLFFLYAPLLFT
jgi:hypothetical protein